MRPTLRHYLAIGTLLGSLALHGASAQVDSAGCVAAVARWQAALTSQEYSNSLGAVRRWCLSAAPALIAGAWLAPPTDSASLSVLAFFSGNYHDERIFRALTAALLDDGHPRKVRLAATSALIMQTSPCLCLGSSQTVRDRDSLYTFVSIAHISDNSATNGSSPVEGEPVSRVLKAFSDLSRSSADMTMRSHAVGVLRELSRPTMKKWFNCTP